MVLKKKTEAIIYYFKKRFTSQSATRALSKNPPSSFIRYKVFPVVYILALFLLAAGLVNSVTEGLNLSAPGSVILPTRGAQTIAETMVNFFTIALGTSGFYVVYVAAKQSSKPRIANFYLIVGIGLIVLALLVGTSIVDVKRF